MEFWREAVNPWGQSVLIGISWDLLWAALIAGAIFVIGHAIFVRFIAPADVPTAPATAAGVPEKIVRHSFAARAFHWLMSVAMFVLLITAFFPVVGIQFAWVTIHWIAGVGLLLTVVYHIVHALGWQDVWSMWVTKDDIREGMLKLRSFVSKPTEPEPRTGKYPADHKMYHHVIVVVAGAAIVTGVLMMLRIDTWFWEGRPYLLADRTWGFVYVVHGLAGVALITLVMAHVYFAIRPDKWWMTMSMINGEIDREHYLAHHDPARWEVGGTVEGPRAGVGGAADLPEGAVRQRRSSAN